MSRVGEATSSIAASSTIHPVGAGIRRYFGISRSVCGTREHPHRPQTEIDARRSATVVATSWLHPSKGWCDYIGRAGKIACALLGEPRLVVLGNQIVDLLHKQRLKLV